MLHVKNYQLLKVNNTRNFKRICNEIKKIEYINSVSIETTNSVMHIEYDIEFELTDEFLNEIEVEILKAIHEYEKKVVIEKIDTQEKFRKVLYLKGLDCTHCAGRIEALAKKSMDYEQIVVDYTTGRFIIETYNKATIETLVANVARISRRVDDKIIVVDSKVHKEEKFEDVQTTSKTSKICFIVGVSIFVVLLALSFFYKIPFWAYLPSYILVGYPVVLKFFKNLFRGHVFDENFLMTVASIGAFITDHASEAVMVVALFQIGELLQAKAINHSRRSIKNLLDFDIKHAKLKLNSDVMEVEVESLIPGDIVIVNKGEIIPADGVVVAGKTNIDIKNLTGESMQKTVEVGDAILSGSVNMGKKIEVKIKKPYGDSMISKIMDLVENATSAKGKTETLITRFSRYYTPIVVLIALSMVVTGLTFDFKNVDHWIYVAMEFLVISCPCALVISIPLCYFSAIGTASKRGILVKGSNYIEVLNGVKNIVLDKTGTLTKGVFTVTNVVSFDEEIPEERLLRILIHAEYYSNHPIGISIVDNYGRDKIFPEIITEFQDITGGTKSVINGSTVLVGNDKLMQANKIEYPEIESSNLVIHIVRNKKYIGYVEIGDIIKDEAVDTITKLRKYGYKCYMLTGDSETIAQSVANKIGIDEYYSQLLPHQKVEKLEEIQSKSKGKTMFIGDGINDAPVIASADVGVAMGNAGSDATIAIADMVIMGDNLSKITESLVIARYTKKKVVENIVFCLAVKFCVMALAIILGLISTSGEFVTELPLGLAIFSDVGVSLLAILNSLLIMKLYKKNNTKQEVIIDE